MRPGAYEAWRLSSTLALAAGGFGFAKVFLQADWSDQSLAWVLTVPMFVSLLGVYGVLGAVITLTRANKIIYNADIQACSAQTAYLLRHATWLHWQGDEDHTLEGPEQLTLCSALTLASGGVRRVSVTGGDPLSIFFHGNRQVEELTLRAIAHHAGLAPVKRSTRVQILREMFGIDDTTGYFNLVNTWAGTKATKEQIEEVLECVTMDPRPSRKA